MGPIPDVLTEEVKKSIYDELADLLISAEGKGLIFEEEVQKSADFIFENLEKIKTKKELMDFLQVLGKKWDVYQNAYLRLKKEDLITQVHSELNQLAHQ